MVSRRLLDVLIPKIKQIMLEQELEGKKYKQSDMAKELKVTQQQFSLWVRGKSFPRVDKLFKLANMLGVKVDDLYEYKED